jgi:predicted phosphodiesterase
MANFLLWSDLHLELGKDIPALTPKMREADALLIAGDLHSRGRHVDAAAEMAKGLDMPVIMVLGNHEYYDSWSCSLLSQEDENLERVRAQGLDVRILHGEATEVAGVRIVGATLWTDMNIIPEMASIVRTKSFKELEDSIRICSTPTGDKLTSEQWLAWHDFDKGKIIEHLSQPFKGKTLVMSHHLPTRSAVAPERQIGSPAKKARAALFASDLRHIIADYPVDAWIYGHSHDNVCVMERFGDREVPILSNARGYSWEEEGFDPEFMVEL